MYRIMNNLDGIDYNSFFVLAKRETEMIATRESTSHMAVKRNIATREPRRQFFACRVCEPWNALPSYIRSQPTLLAFERDLDAYIQLEGWT